MSAGVCLKTLLEVYAFILSELASGATLFQSLHLLEIHISQQKDMYHDLNVDIFRIILKGIYL